MSISLRQSVRAGPYTCRVCYIRILRAARRSHSTNNLSQFRPKKSQIKSKLPSGPARTRFAPSPTGYLHLGSLRTALFNYLLAKRTGGQFLLRIEDTDQKRTIPDAEQRLFDDLRWAGLGWDEGPEIGGPYGPYKQSERSELYRDHAQKLLETGAGYRCFCTPQRLNELAEYRASLGIATDYDRTCAHIQKEESNNRAAKGERHVIRLKAPEIYPTYTDLIYGDFKPLKPRRRGEEAYEDPILLKSDGLPTYHLANVVDDHHMKITHVIRGTEWMPSTPKHIAMYEAFGWQPPQFAHVGLLTDERGNKLSKRNFDTDIKSMRDEMKILPEALTNFAVLLGWSHNSRSDVMTLKDMIDKFTLKFTKGNAIVTLGKLNFLQNKHTALRAKQDGPAFDDLVDKVVEAIKVMFTESSYRTCVGDRSLEAYVTPIIRADADNYVNAEDFVKRNDFLFKEVKLQKKGDRWLGRRIQEVFLHINNWEVANLKEAIDLAAKPEEPGTSAYARKDVYHHLRSVLADGKAGLGVFDIMMILGQEETLRRLDMGPCTEEVYEAEHKACV